MKTFEVLFVTPHGNGWAIVNSDNVSSVRSILENQSKFQPLDILHIKEVKAICGVNTSIIYEGHCETIVSPYDLAVSQGYEGSLEEWLESLKGDDADVYTITITESYSNDTYSYTCDRAVDEFYENVIAGNKKPLFYLIPYNIYSEKTLLTPINRAVSRGYFYDCDLGYIDTTGTHLHRFRFRVYPSTTSTQANISVIKLDDVNYAKQSDIPTVNDATLTIQKNGTNVGTFTANSSQDKIINIRVPSTAADVNALPASTAYGASLSLTMNSSTYVLTARLRDQNGNNLGSAQTIDLPLESVVVSGSYDSTNKKIVLTLQNGSTIDVPVGDLINGLQSEITAQNPLSADFVTDGNTNKVYTETEKTKLAGIQAGAEVNVQSDWNQSNSSADDYIKNKPVVTPPEEVPYIIYIYETPFGSGVVYSCSATAEELHNNLVRDHRTPLFYFKLFGSYEVVDEAEIICMRTDEFYIDSFDNGIHSSGEGNLIAVDTNNHNIENWYSFWWTYGAEGYEDGVRVDFISSVDLRPDWNQSESHFYNYIKNKPALGTAAALDVAASGNASSTQVVKGDDTRLTDSRPASDVSAWAKASTKPSYTASEVGAIPSSEKGAASGVAELDSNGKVPSSQLPSYVDDVLEYASQSAFPATGESGKIYIALDTNKTYRWSGSAYVEISESLALGETSSTAYAGNKGKANADAIAAIKDGTSIDSFGDVETALADKINKSSTAGLVKNDGTIDTNTYLTQHQDISGKANKSEMSVVDGTGSNADKTTITLKTGTSATVLKSHQDISGKQDVINSSNKLSADYIVDGTTNKVINVKPDWNAASGTDAEILNKPTIPAAQVNSDWNAVSGIAQILNKPTIPSITMRKWTNS